MTDEVGDVLHDLDVDVQDVEGLGEVDRKFPRVAFPLALEEQLAKHLWVGIDVESESPFSARVTIF